MIELNSKKKIKNIITTVIVISNLILVSKSQILPENSYLSSNYHYGFIWAHTKKMRHLVLDHIHGIEINYGSITDGEKQWHKDYHFPEIGICMSAIDLANPQRLGYVVSIYPFINFPMYRRNNYEVFIRCGGGLGFPTKFYDRTSNFKNIAISTPLNAYFNFRLTNRLYITKRLSINSDINLTHFSNGAFSMPNLGINIPTLSIGITYFTINEKTIKPKLKIDTINDYQLQYKNELNTFFSFGIKEGMPVGSKKSIFIINNNEFLHKINKTQQIGLGIDICFDESYLQDLKNSSVIKKDIENTQLGIGFLHNLLISKFRFLFEMGYYVYSKYKGDGVFYHRVGLRYFISQKIYFNMSLKSHFARANNIDIGIGVNLYKK